MMNSITIRCDPRFYLGLTLEEVHLLIEMGKRHYDMTCRQAVIQGGFIYGWCVSLSPVAGEESSEPKLVTGSWRELDLVLKLLEFNGPIEARKMELLVTMREHILFAMKTASAELRGLEFETVELTKEERVEILRAKQLADVSNTEHYDSVEHMLDAYYIPKFKLKEKK